MQPEQCICYDCIPFIEEEGCPGSCDTAGPFYDEEACTSCKYNRICDVPKNPENYKND